MTSVCSDATAYAPAPLSSPDRGVVASRETKQVASYAGSRPDILRHLRQPAMVLDVGCNRGATARSLRDRYPQARVWGIDINAEVLADSGDAFELIHLVNLDDTKQLQSVLGNQRFDTIIAADVLEHTVDPWRICELLVQRLSDGGQLLISVPNFGHWETFFHLVRQTFPRRSRGLYDDTHLRFFMRGNVCELERAGGRLSIAGRNFRLFERRQFGFDRLLSAMIGRIPWLREFFVFQYILQIERPAT